MAQPVNDNPAPDRDTRRRKLLFRAWHRGTKEMDLLLGGFAADRIDAMTDAELDAFETLLNVPDQDLYTVLVSGAPVPAALDGPLMRTLIAESRSRFTTV